MVFPEGLPRGHGGVRALDRIKELLVLTLLLSPWPWLTIVAAAIMVTFHLFIISTFPLAVPVEWNLLFAYATIFLFWASTISTRPFTSA